MIFLRLALFNLLKNRRRTILIVFAIMVSVLVMEVVAGMFEGMRLNFFRNLTGESGHVQIHREGYGDRLNPYTLDYVISDYRGKTHVLREMPRVRAAEEVLHFAAILEHGGRDLTLAGAGVRSDTVFYRSVREGIREGAFFAEEVAETGILISRSVADLLRVHLGEGIHVVVEDSTGSPFYMKYPVIGIFYTASPDFDEHTFLIAHEAAQELVYLEEKTIEIRLLLDHPDHAEDVAAKAEEYLRKDGTLLSSESLEIRPWREVHGGVTTLLEMMNFFMFIMNASVVVVAASVITNAILMNVFERMRVIGTMRAIGLKRRSAGAMILLEGLIQGLAGSILGLAAGIPVVLHYSNHGVDWGGISEAFGMGSSLYYFGYSPMNSVLSALGGILVALAGSLYAARAGMRLSIMEALRNV